MYCYRMFWTPEYFFLGGGAGVLKMGLVDSRQKEKSAVAHMRVM